jgi:hypothetical protein
MASKRTLAEENARNMKTGCRKAATVIAVAARSSRQR